MQQIRTVGPDSAVPARPLLRTRVTWGLALFTSALHALVAVLQPVFAGVFLNGDLDAMKVHGVFGSMLVAFTMMVLGPAVLLFLVPGKGSFWPLLMAVGLFFAEGVQVGMGYARQFAIHVPLGVAIVGVSVALVWYLVGWRVRLGRKLRGGR